MRIVAIGDCLVDLYPDMGQMFPGGNALNVAVAARRAGCHAAFVGAVGDDEAGEAVLAALRDEAVEHTRVRVVPGPTSHATVQLIEGERSFTSGDIGVSEIRIEPADEAYIAGFDLIHSGDNSLLEQQVPALARLAPLSFDFGSRPEAYCAPLLPHTRVAIFSVAGEDAARTILQGAAEAGVRVGLATAGAAGAWMLQAGELHHAPARPGAVVVDTLGAGDAFTGRFLVSLLAGDPPATMLAHAAEAAAAAVAQNGAFGHGRPAVEVGGIGRRVP